MINGFTEETKPLTDYELDVLLPILIQGLMNKKGKDKAVKNCWICRCLKGQGYKIDEARVRKLINHIRVHGMVIGLIATNAGYYIAENAEEIDDYILSLNGREQAIKAVRISLERQRDIMYG
jgi:hypothetical protein